MEFSLLYTLCKDHIHRATRKMRFETNDEHAEIPA